MHSLLEGSYTQIPTPVKVGTTKNAPVNISHVVDVVQGLEHPLQDVSNRQLIHAIHEVRTDEILCGT